jgi:hypothetical protein
LKHFFLGHFLKLCSLFKSLLVLKTWRRMYMYNALDNAAWFNNIRRFWLVFLYCLNLRFQAIICFLYVSNLPKWMNVICITKSRHYHKQEPRIWLQSMVSVVEKIIIHIITKLSSLLFLLEILEKCNYFRMLSSTSATM